MINSQLSVRRDQPRACPWREATCGRHARWGPHGVARAHCPGTACPTPASSSGHRDARFSSWARRPDEVCAARATIRSKKIGLLERADWTRDGYRLFDISVFAGSSQWGWFAPIAESNALFMPEELWTEIGGYDERFVSTGGGLVNLDTFVRACALPTVN